MSLCGDASFAKAKLKGVINVEEWKVELGKKALELGILNDPQWLDRLDDSMPLWAILQIAFQLIERLDPPSISYD
jgi:hypothetical protein